MFNVENSLFKVKWSMFKVPGFRLRNPVMCNNPKPVTFSSFLLFFNSVYSAFPVRILFVCLRLLTILQLAKPKW